MGESKHFFYFRPLPEEWLFDEEVKVIQLKDKMAKIIN